MALDQHRARALLDHDQRAREQRGRLVAGRSEHEMDRPLERRARRDVDHDAVAHEGGVERDRRDRRSRRPCRGAARPAHRRPRAPPPSSGWSRPARGRRDRTAPARTRRRRTRAGGTRRRRAARRHPWRAPSRRHRRARERLGVAHQRAQVGVFPLLDAPVRQARRGEALERGLAQRRGARQPAFAGLPLGRELLLGGGLHQGRLRPSCLIHAACVLELRVAARPRARAPAPCRRSSRCGPCDSTCTMSGTM